MKMDVRAAKSSRGMELYVTATPDELGSPAAEAKEIFAAIAALLRNRHAWICMERVFAPSRDVPSLQTIRREAYGENADGIEPTFLATEDAPGVMSGVQVYAVRIAGRPQIITAEGMQARVFHLNGLKWVTASGVNAVEAGDGAAQARATFRKAESLLRRSGGDLKALARTWVFMDDVLSWYGQFNQARSGFFLERGILGPESAGRLPASTGIGISPADGSRCNIDLFAVIGPDGSVARHEAAGKQRSANEYGSAFARAAVAETPAGKTVFVSGTAAINMAGATCCRDDIAGQIDMTIENVKAVLRQLAVGDDDVVQTMAYCVSPEVQKVFRQRWAGKLPWPRLVMRADICRNDLVFEVEVTACSGAKRIEV